ncbi:MAG: class II aldolase/adducin family protein [Anaerolineaceae bacterium]|nr:class II aldolase/adducin family protein [Anaerolineaceae bacterium]
MEIQEAREIIAAYGKEIYDRHLTDSSGANISIRIGDNIVMTPTKAGARYHWNINPNQILVLDMEGNVLDGDGKLSREAKVHYALLREFYPQATCVMHTHARNVLVFCAAEKAMPPVLDCTSPFGVIEQCAHEVTATQGLADTVLEKIRAKGGVSKAKAAACMAPRHGLFVLARDIYDAFEVTERMDTNAYCILMAQKLGVIQPLEGQPVGYAQYDK